MSKRWSELKTSVGDAAGVLKGHGARFLQSHPPAGWLGRLRLLLPRRGVAGAYCELGLRPALCALSYVLTLVFYLTANTWLGGRIDRVYYAHHAKVFDGTTNTSTAVDRLVDPEIGIANPNSRTASTTATPTSE